MKRSLSFILWTFIPFALVWAQNETVKWYFGSTAAVDFLSGSPVALTNSVMSSSEGSASIANAAGNLLFYTNGNTVWNANHLAMSNGTGLFGSGISCQSAVIVRQPGSANLYYVFTMRNWTDAGNGAHFSIVDMTLAAGLGDVTVKNQLIYGNTRESLTAVCHANGTDFWIVIHDMFTNEFRSYLLTAGGLNAVPVISAVGSVFSGGNRYGALKASPDGTRLGYALGGSGGVTTEIYDFDRNTGAVSNPITLNNGAFPNAYGIEFSSNNQVLYVCQYNGTTIQQFNLAAGSPALVVASNTVISSGANVKANLQSGPDGKIYACLAYQAFLGVITNPNTLGLGCNFVNNSVNLAGRTCGLGLPNFMPCLLPVILPMDWTHFEGKTISKDVLLNWGIANAVDAKSMIVERKSADEIDFRKVAELTLPSPNVHEFEWVDHQPLHGVNAYRIVIENLAGGRSVSEIVNVVLDSHESRISISPNPISQTGCWDMEIQNFVGKMEVEIVNADLQTIYSWNGEKGDDLPMKICLEGQSSGVYYGKVTLAGKGIQTCKLMRL